MKYLQSKIILPAALLIIVLLLLVWVCYFSDKEDAYYIVTTGHVDLSPGDPVILENIPAGAIEAILPGDDTVNKTIIRFKLSDQYSIPSKSSVQLVSSTENSQGLIHIDVQASRDYYHPGDTIYSYSTLKGGIESIQESGRKFDGLLVYKIQVLASEKRMPADSPKFRGLEKIAELYVKGTYKYYVGNLESFAEAKKFRAIVVEKGIADAFIVPFINDERISIQQALSYEK